MAFSSLRHQWHHPSGVFSVLLIVRGDVIQKAVAQLAGGAFNITPVAFSFGWVSFGVSTLLSVIGEGKLMPEVDCPSIVVNVGNGYRRTNSSWVLGRVLRDQELSFSSEYANPALVVTIFNASGENNIQVSSRVSQQTNPTDLERAEQPTDGRAKKQQGVPVLDLVWSMGMIVMFVQCMVAAVPGIVKKDWLIFTVALGGTLLALAGGALPQWREEKWSCRKLDECDAVQENLPMSKTIILTRGNGHRHVLVICSDGTGLNLEVSCSQPLHTHRV